MIVSIRLEIVDKAKFPVSELVRLEVPILITIVFIEIIEIFGISEIRYEIPMGARLIGVYLIYAKILFF